MFSGMVSLGGKGGKGARGGGGGGGAGGGLSSGPPPPLPVPHYGAEGGLHYALVADGSRWGRGGACVLACVLAAGVRVRVLAGVDGGLHHHWEPVGARRERHV